MTGKIAHHEGARNGTSRNDWGTPTKILDLVRRLFIAPIRLDPATSEEANERVKASRIFTEETDGLTSDWQYVGTAFCNPPGPGEKVQAFWSKWCSSEIAAGVFLVFNSDHFRSLPPPRPNRKTFVLHPKKRLKFFGAKSGASFPSVLLVHGVDIGHIKRVCGDDYLITEWRV